jgi:hypothetical protein
LTINPLPWETPKDISHTSLVKEHRIALTILNKSMGSCQSAVR